MWVNRCLNENEMTKNNYFISLLLTYQWKMYLLVAAYIKVFIGAIGKLK